MQIEKRRTIRKFKQIPLTKEQLAHYIDVARVAPSAANLQPLKYVAVQSPEMVEKLFPLVKWAGYLAPAYNPKEDECPTAYIAVCADDTIPSGSVQVDMGAAVMSLMLAALEDGVGACWMGAVNFPEATKLLELPQNLKLLCVVALGYPAESPKEAEVKNGNIQYYLDESGTLCVPKRTLEEVMVKTV